MNTTNKEKGAEEAEVKGRRRPEPGERERVVAEWAAGAKTVEEMAAATGWSTYTLYRWRSDIKLEKGPKEVGGPKLLPVPKPGSATLGAWAAEVMLGHGMSVRLTAACAPAWAAQLVGELKRC